MKRVAFGLLLLAAVLSARPAVAAAQSVDVRLTPRVGALTPVDWFYEEFKRFGALPLQWTRSAIQKAPVVGLAAEVELADNGLWLRGEVTRTLDGEASLTHSVYTPPSTAGPAQVTYVRYLIPATMTVASLDVGLPTAFRLPYGIQPYVTAGIGGKTYTFDTSSVDEFADDMVLPQEGTSLVYNVGGGAVFRVLGVELDFLVRDAISDYWERSQHDVMVLGGVRWEVF